MFQKSTLGTPDFRVSNISLLIWIKALKPFVKDSVLAVLFGWGKYAYILGGRLSNDEGGGEEKDKKAIALDWQNNNFARASRFFVHFFAVVAQLRRETSQFLV